LRRIRERRNQPADRGNAAVCALKGTNGPGYDPSVASLEKHRRDWEDLARLDPMWAVVSDNDRRFGGWDADEFFATGEREVAPILARAAALGVPATHADALEFGCGVGRVTRALAGRFDRVVGVDISTEMLSQARELNAGVPNVEFAHNTATDLTFVGDRRFDLVYSRHVLQHLPDREVAGAYLREMVRIVRPGGLVLVHLPLRIPVRHRLLIVRRAYELLRRLGISADTLYTKLKLHPVSMLAVPEAQIRAWAEQAGGRVLAVDSKQGAVLSANVYITRDHG
jgi:SAM-dependent methyltransferase